MIERAGVIAVQGDVNEHAQALTRAFGEDTDVVRVRTPADAEGCDLLVLPGGESTTISRLVSARGLDEAIRAHVADGDILLATCAGLILAATDVPDERIKTLDLLDIEVDRNAYGRQRESFEAGIEVTGMDAPFSGIFIRAPRIRSVGDAEVIARLEGEPVAVRQGPVVGASFHPELTDDPQFHRAVLPMAAR